MGKIWDLIQEAKDSKKDGFISQVPTTGLAATGAGLALGGIGAKVASSQYFKSFEDPTNTISGGIKKGLENMKRITTDPNYETKVKFARAGQDYGIPMALGGAGLLGAAIATRLLTKKKKKV